MTAKKDTYWRQKLTDVIGHAVDDKLYDKFINTHDPESEIMKVGKSVFIGKRNATQTADILDITRSKCRRLLTEWVRRFIRWYRENYEKQWREELRNANKN